MWPEWDAGSDAQPGELPSTETGLDGTWLGTVQVDGVDVHVSAMLTENPDGSLTGQVVLDAGSYGLSTVEVMGSRSMDAVVLMTLPGFDPGVTYTSMLTAPTILVGTFAAVGYDPAPLSLIRQP